MILSFLNKIFHKKKFSARQGELYSYVCSLVEVTPRDFALYEQALTHRSVSGRSNERLEYLGDAMLGMVVADCLYHLFPGEGEGFLTRARSNAVCRHNLNRVAKQIGINRHLHTGAPLKKNTENIYGNALEALVGAVYLDAGYEAATAFVRKVLVGKDGAYLRQLSEHETDFKSRLLEYARAHNLNAEFSLIDEQYDAHTDRHTFLYGVSIDGNEVARATGSTKAHAQQAASRKALKSMAGLRPGLTSVD
ncbi:MAG: ribonuclease III [Paludibacteraceae bacterium]|nr:ribonuclease III [Paludibacteraceae bacterium]